jgi:hypothetical protein
MAVKALGQTADTRAVDPLIAILKDPAADVESGAVNALAKIGGASVDHLIVALQDSDSKIQTNAAAALGKIGAPAVEPLIIALRSGESVTKQGAGVALSMVGAPAIDSLKAALDDNDDRVRRIALDTLGKIKDVRAYSALGAAPKDSGSDVRASGEHSWDKVDDLDWSVTSKIVAQGSFAIVQSGGTASISGISFLGPNGPFSFGSGMWSARATWNLDVKESIYKPGPMPVKSLKVSIESRRDPNGGVLAAVTGEEANGTPISASVFTPWNMGQWATPKVTGNSPYYCTIAIILGTPMTSFSVGNDISFGPLLAFSNPWYSIDKIKWKVKTLNSASVVSQADRLLLRVV